MKNSARYLIQITSAPAGEAPLNFREKWVGLYLVGVFYRRRPEQEIGIVSKAPIEYRPIYSVPTAEALKALRGKSEEAYMWFLQNVSAFSEHLNFGANEARIVRRVRN